MPKKTASKEKPEVNEQELQKKYFQFQMMKQQLTALVEEKNAIDEKISEISMSIESMKKLENIKKGDEMWSSLGSGAFVRSDVKDIDNVFVAAGAGVVIKQKRSAGIEILASRLEQLQKIDIELITEINKFSEQAQRLEQELQHAVENR